MEELSIRVYGEPILRTMCEETEDNTVSRQRASNLMSYLNKMEFAVGVAAPQVGLNDRMFCMLDNQRNLLVVINPQIKKRSGNMPFSEGCLSIPKIFGKTEIRSKYLTATYYDEHFNLKTKTFRGTEAVVFQHEYDHLNGILFIDHMSKDGREMIAETLNKIERHPIRTYHPLFKGDSHAVYMAKFATY